MKQEPKFIGVLDWHGTDYPTFECLDCGTPIPATYGKKPRLCYECEQMERDCAADQEAERRAALSAVGVR